MTSPSEEDGIAEADLDDLNRPETFASLWRQAAAAVRPRRCAYVLVEALAFVGVFLTAHLSNALTSEIAKVVREGSDKLFGFAGAILGIIIAAFAILATIAQSDAIVALAVRVEGKKILELKKVALLFVAAFVPFVVFIAWYAVLLLIGWQGGIATSFTLAYPRVGRAIACGILGGTAFGLTRMVIVLAALITNVYVTFMLIARAKIEKDGDIISTPDQSGEAASPQLPPATRGAAAVVSDPRALEKVSPKN